MKISKEVQFTDWLFHKPEDVLVPIGFVVEPEYENKSLFPNICHPYRTASLTTTTHIVTAL